MKKTIVVTAALLAGFCSASNAQGYYPQQQQPSMRVQIAEMNAPRTILQRGLGDLIAFMSENRQPTKEALAEYLDTQIAPYFDFAYMARWAGGPRWTNMTTAEKLRMESQIKQMFLSTLAEKLSNFGDQQVRVLRPRRGQGNEVSIDVAIMNARGYPARLKFRFYYSRNGWRIFDVAANGSSATMYYRKLFNRSPEPRGRSGWTGRP